jgi:glycosyltransferase involved in cell wall biosynthesis
MEMTHATSHGAISSFLDDMDEAALVGKRARKLVERHFTWDKVADSTIDVYGNVVANGRKY